MKKTISVSQIKQAVNEAYDLYKNNQDGKNSDYIPYLANIDKNCSVSAYVYWTDKLSKSEILNINSV